ncbi:MAG: squalene/phytoene synthase family protein [Alphaproteobacteria bacterium]|nr:squalene/phytoene synthase family protein [Alphaproteobacteria bacterium]
MTVLVAPAFARRRLLALFAFQIELARTRETIREPHMGLIRLQWWRDALAEARAGAPRRHPVVLELAPSLVDGTLPLDDLTGLVDARERDIDDSPPESLAALESYASATSGALAILALRVLGETRADAAGAARAVGTAWALTGLLRAAPFHAAVRRCYLPADLIDAQNLDLESWFAGRAGAAAAPIVAAVAARAGTTLAQAAREAVPRNGFAAVAPAVLVPAHLRRLARAAHDVFDARFQRPLPSAALRLWLASWTGRW